MTTEVDRKGCLMAMANERSARIIQEWSKKYIPDNILYLEGNDYGREMETHVTILYGFIKDLTPDQVNSIIKDTKPFPIQIKGIQVFSKPDYDVITLKVESPELTRLNEISKQFPYKSSYPVYNPHLTLAYVLPGKGKKYDNVPAKTITSITCDGIMYSGINKAKTPYRLLEMETPPAIIQPAEDSSISADFINFVKKLENQDKVGFKNGKWYPYNDPGTGNLKAIAYGHRFKTDKEDKKFSNGIDDREATKLLVKDLMEAKNKVRKYIDEKYRIHLILDKKQMEMLIEFAFNLGGLEKFPKFTDAVIRKDWAKAAQEYKRGYVSASGARKELTRRNQLFFDRYLK
jgi:GH24 family phage-related lysozyme (muramidase)